MARSIRLRAHLAVLESPKNSEQRLSLEKVIPVFQQLKQPLPDSSEDRPKLVGIEAVTPAPHVMVHLFVLQNQDLEQPIVHRCGHQSITARPVSLSPR